MNVSKYLAALCVGLAIACGGGSVGEYAANFAEYQESQEEVPCPTYSLGEEVSIGNFTYVFEGTELSQGENKLPWIRNMDERRSFSRDGIKAIVVKYKVRNDSPIAQRREAWFVVQGTDGEKGGGGPYNEELYEKEHDLPDISGTLAPGKWYEAVDISSINPSATDGAVAHFKRREQQLDIRGRKIKVLVEQAVVDLGTPIEGPHVNPEKRGDAPTTEEAAPTQAPVKPGPRKRPTK